jgi:hypothetical protein
MHGDQKAEIVVPKQRKTARTAQYLNIFEIDVCQTVEK